MGRPNTSHTSNMGGLNTSYTNNMGRPNTSYTNNMGGLTLHTPMTITVMSVPLLLLCFPALLQNQKRQMQKLQEAISHQRIIVNKLRSEVSVMETSMIESSHVNRSLPSVSVCTCETYSFILSHVDHFMPSVIIHLVLLTYPVPFKMHLVGCYSIIS